MVKMYHRLNSYPGSLHPITGTAEIGVVAPRYYSPLAGTGFAEG
ncbi:MAG: hypothetical protein V4722_21130 [Bacteroidota bacterium]